MSGIRVSANNVLYFTFKQILKINKQAYHGFLKKPMTAKSYENVITEKN